MFLTISTHFITTDIGPNNYFMKITRIDIKEKNPGKPPAIKL